MRRLLMRAGLTAPWFGITLDHDMRALQRDWEAMDVEEDLPGGPIRQPRASRRTGRSWQSRAVLPCPALTKIAPGIWPYLILGEQTHIGRGAVAGSGRYVLLF